MFWSIKQWVLRELADWRALADIQELAKLSDAQLDDIGLRREQLFMLESQPIDEREAPVGGPAFRPGLEPRG